MVTITDYKEIQRENGTSFCLLQVQGGVEIIKSKQTGKFYATVKKAYVPSTFDKLICESIIGTQMSGEIKKENCEPFEHTVKETGEVITLSHRWVYIPKEESEKEKEIPLSKEDKIFKPAYS